MWQQIQLQDRIQTFYMPVNLFFSSNASNNEDSEDNGDWRCCLLPTHMTMTMVVAVLQWHIGSISRTSSVSANKGGVDNGAWRCCVAPPSRYDDNGGGDMHIEKVQSVQLDCLMSAVQAFLGHGWVFGLPSRAHQRSLLCLPLDACTGDCQCGENSGEWCVICLKLARYVCSEVQDTVVWKWVLPLFALCILVLGESLHVLSAGGCHLPLSPV